MDFRLINLHCPACGSAMRGEPTDILFFCTHCGSAATLGTEGLDLLESTAILPAAGRRAEIWKPAWMIEAEVSIEDRIRFNGARTTPSRSRRSFLIPAFEVAMRDLSRLTRALSAAIGNTGEIPHEACHGGVLDLEDAIVLLRHLCLEEEIEKPDRLASIKIDLHPVSHRFCLIPFEKDRAGLRCAVTGIPLPPGSLS